MADRCDLLREGACHALACGAGAAGALCRDQLHDALGTREVEPSVQKGALRELARLGRTRTRLPRPQQHLTEDDVPAVALQLHNILARIRVRCTHGQQDPLVNDAAVRRCDLSIVRAVGRDLPKITPHRAEDLPCNGKCVRSTHANDADAARAVCGGDLADRILCHFPIPCSRFHM